MHGVGILAIISEHPVFFKITHQKIDSQYPVPIWYQFNLSRFDAGAAAISGKFA
tara:strand:- start:298 stop:459 length:162 start_codon:yes stop_codon:yes gene_type:complete